jgi:hypothetical protein
MAGEARLNLPLLTKRSEAYTTKLHSPEVYGNLDETVDEPLKYVIFVNLDVQLDLGDPNNHTLGHPHPSNQTQR